MMVITGEIMVVTMKTKEMKVGGWEKHVNC